MLRVWSAILEGHSTSNAGPDLLARWSVCSDRLDGSSSEERRSSGSERRCWPLAQPFFQGDPCAVEMLHLIRFASSTSIV
jgi:hypothetical protein